MEGSGNIQVRKRRVLVTCRRGDDGGGSAIITMMTGAREFDDAQVQKPRDRERAYQYRVLQRIQINGLRAFNLRPSEERSRAMCILKECS